MHFNILDLVVGESQKKQHLGLEVLVAPSNGQAEVEQILVFDTRTMGIASIITPCQPFWGISLSSDGRHLYASSPDTKAIMVIDADTNQTMRTFKIGAGPFILLSVKAP